MQGFVATDAEGVQHLGGQQRAWPLPAGGEAGAPAVSGDGGDQPQVLDADALLEHLGERIFLAESTGGKARLMRELGWDLHATAAFALDCAEHALATTLAAGAEEQLLPDGSSLAEVLSEAREFLVSAEAEDRHLGALARLSLARRLGKDQAQVAGLALAAIREDEDADLDVLDDPRWANLAALSDALLACIEVLRHLALPRYVAAREHVVVADGEQAPDPGRTWITAWGPVAPVAGHVPSYVPAYVSARDAAERARRAVADLAGARAGDAERSYQRARLLELLGAG